MLWYNREQEYKNWEVSSTQKRGRRVEIEVDDDRYLQMMPILFASQTYLSVWSCFVLKKAPRMHQTPPHPGYSLWHSHPLQIRLDFWHEYLIWVEWSSSQPRVLPTNAVFNMHRIWLFKSWLYTTHYWDWVASHKFLSYYCRYCKEFAPIDLNI